MYLVLETQFEYNDEILYTENSIGCGRPVGLFKKKDSAENLVRTKVIGRLRKTNIGDYCYSLRGLGISEYDPLFEKYNVSTEDTYDISLPSQASDDEIWEFYQRMENLNFYSIVKIELDESES